ncbi:hypothetical protein AN639_02250 [Candidatus Epulonipiscium fishelsonii]|uniref:Uncharacterized protein n=1 Tax=Candidatus Epulonipiscium fishelsonii TaxID=77094 RepID=A0ACC8XGW9_9FIRM|nr:hypothetical protein AN639_02250 [Epulopiscium sp. SCG-B05WGA-EpuloA1]ONI42994.1 hypothetical protein AN396_00085 [Epulopiscium sp. SCG-B11WGA-EpuloA1]
MNIENFLNLEAKYDLLNIEYKGFKYWQYIRFTLYSHLKIMENQLEKNEVVEYSKYNPLRYKSLIKNIKKIPWLNEINNDILFIPSIPANSKNRESFITPLYKEIQKSHIVLEQNPLLFINLFENTITGVDLWIVNKSLQLLLLTKIKNEFKKITYRIAKLIRKELDIKIDINYLSELISRSYLIWKIGSKYYKYLLKRINPKVIIEVCYYSYTNMIINEVSKELNIPTIELQHGVMGPDHISYNFKIKSRYGTFPDNIFTFSKYWNDTTRFPIENVKEIGFPFLENQVNYYTKNNNSKRNKKVILFISQWAYSNQLSNLAIDLYEYLKKINNTNYRIIYRLHPGDDLHSSKLKKLLSYKSKIEISKPTKPIYEDLNKSSVQISVNSTAVYEGFAFELITLIYNISDSKNMQDLIDLGYATYINSSEQIIENISKNNDRKKIKTENFWKKNALNNMIKEIDAIIDMELLS